MDVAEARRRLRQMARNHLDRLARRPAPPPRPTRLTADDVRELLARVELGELTERDRALLRAIGQALSDH